jgi:2-iminobutanoate/2-iminopropanoate deaminase
MPLEALAAKGAGRGLAHAHAFCHIAGPASIALHGHFTQVTLTRSDPMRLASLIVAGLLCACAPAHRAPEFIASAGGAVRPFSPAVRTNGFLYLSGQIGTDSTGRVVPGGAQAETRQAMENIRAVLLRAGSSMERVVKCTVFMADMRDWSAMNEIYVTFFDAGRRPARSAMGASGLALDARVEIECIAAE